MAAQSKRNMPTRITKAGGTFVAIARIHTDDKELAAMFETCEGGAWSLDHPSEQNAQSWCAPSHGGFGRRRRNRWRRSRRT